MTRKKDLTDLTGLKCMSPGCRGPADRVFRSIDRRGQPMAVLRCERCAEKRNAGIFASAKHRRTAAQGSA